MKRRNYFLLLILLTVWSCKSNTQTEIASDSTSIQSTEVASPYVQTQAPSQDQSPGRPSSNFPEFSETALSEDPTESEIMFDLKQLITEYDNQQYGTIESYYSRQRDYEGEYEEQTETEEVTETWFFNESNQLRAFARKYFRSGEGRDTKTLICLFSNDSLIALSDYWDEDGQIGMAYHTKLIRSKCPNCGIDSNREAGDNSMGRVRNYLNENDLVERESEFFTTLPNVISAIGKEWKNATESATGFVATVEHDQWPERPSEGKAYSQTYTISKELYKAYASRLNWLNAFAKKPFTLTSYTSITNYLKKEKIDFTDDIFNGEQLINFEESQIIVNENSKDLICSAYIESPKISFSKNIKIGMTEEAFLKTANLNKSDILTDGQRYFDYTLESKNQSWIIEFMFEENVLTSFKYTVTPCGVSTSNENL